MKISFGLLVVGFGLILYAMTLSPYTDEKTFNDRYSSLSQGQSTEYWKLREEMLTPKYALQDFGGTACAAGLTLLLLIRTRFRTPSKRWPIATVAVAASFSSVGAYAFDLLQSAARGEFPPWGDTLAIPLAAVPILFIAFVLWALVHLVFLKSPYMPARPLALALSWESNKWLLFVSLVTTALIALSAIEGTYWYIVPGLLWLYIYLALAAGRHPQNDGQPSPGNNAHAAQPVSAPRALG